MAPGKLWNQSVTHRNDDAGCGLGPVPPDEEDKYGRKESRMKQCQAEYHLGASRAGQSLAYREEFLILVS
jgi:hypothetical protein